MGLFSCLRRVQPEEAPATKAKPSKYADLAAWSDSTSNTLAHDPRKVNVMDVMLVKASGLLAMDMNLFGKGSSDPLAILRCAGLEFKSTTKKRTLAPYWKESFRFPLLDSTKDEVLEIEIEDYDLISGNDFMGTCKINLQYLQLTETMKVDLEGRKGKDKERGSIELEITLSYDEKYDYFPEEKPMHGEPNLLMIGITRGRDLLPMDIQLSSAFRGSTTSDPKCSITIANQTFSTDMIAKTLNPQWHFRCEVQVEGPSHTIEVHVEDVDVLSGNDFMGRCEIELDDYADGKRHRRWHPLLDKKGRQDKQRGDVEVVIRWVHEPRLRRFVDDDKGEGPANELCVCVVQASGLLAMDRSMMGLGKATLSDPLAKVRLGGGSWSCSPHVPKTLKPFWNREFRLPISSEDIERGATTLDIEVEDYDKGSLNDFMGSVTIPIIIERGPSSRAWHALKGPKGVDGGRVEVQLRCVRNPALVHFDEDNKSQYKKEKPNELRVAIIGAQNLVDEGGVVPQIDPRCAVHLWPFSRSTKSRASRQPTWNAAYTFRVPSSDTFDAFGGDCAASEVPTAMECSVRSKGRVLGRVLLGLKELKDRKVRKGFYTLTDQEEDSSIAKPTNNSAKDGPCVEVWAQWLYNPDADFDLEGENDDASGLQAPNLLRVALLCATGLEKDEACCAAKASGHVARTSMLSSSALEWHAAFALPIDTSSQFLRVALESTPGDEFGYSTIPLTNLKDGKVKRGWLAVRKIAAPGALSLGDVFLQAKAAAPRPAPAWSAPEDAELTRLVQVHDSDWNTIAAAMPGRDDRDCRKRWIYTLDPTTAAPVEAPPEEEPAVEGVVVEEEDESEPPASPDEMDPFTPDKPHWCRFSVEKRDVKWLLKKQWSKLAAARALQQGGHGRVEIAARWVYDAALDHFPDDDGVAARPNCLKIAVIGGRGLSNAKRRSLPRDTYVSIKMGPDVAFTSSIEAFPAEDRPRWNCAVSLPVENEAPLELNVYAAKKLIASGTFTVDLSDKGRHRRWFDLSPTSRCGKDLADKVPPGLDLIMRWSYEPSYDFGKRRGHPDEDIAREPNEVGLAVVQVREKIENARPSLWRPGRELAPYSVKLKCGPKLEATTNAVEPVYGGAVFVGDATSLRKPKQGHAKGTPLEITVERQGRVVGVGSTTVDEIFSSTSKVKRIRTWVSLGPPKRRGALAKLKDVPQKTARALHGGPYGAELEVEVAAWVCFNASRTARLGRLERDLGHERSRPLAVCWYEVAKGGSVVVAPAARSLLRPPLYEDGRVAVVEEVRHRAVGEAGGRKRRAQRPQAMYPQGALLRSTPIVRFAGLRGAHACAALSEAVARLEGLDAPFSLRVDHWAGELRGSYGEAVRFPRDPPGVGRRRRPLPRRGGEWHERYRARLNDGSPAHLNVARLERLATDYQGVRRGDIAREVALVASLSMRDDIVQPLGAWLGAARGPGVALPFEDRVSLTDHAGGGKGALYDQDRAALVASRITTILRDAAAAVGHCHSKNVLHGGVSHDSFVVAQKPRGPVLQLTGFELASPLIVPQQKSGRPMTTPLPTALVRGYVPAYRSPEVEKAVAQLAQAASRRQLEERRAAAAVTAAEGDVWALGVLALNLFEPRRLRRAQQCPPPPPPPKGDDTESDDDDEGPFSLEEWDRDEPLPRDASQADIRKRDHFDPAGERARSSYDAYARKDLNGQKMSSDAVRTWLRKRVQATLDQTPADATTTRQAAQLLIETRTSARLDGRTLLRHASDPARILSFLGLARGERSDTSASQSQNTSPYTSKAPSSHSPERTSSPASSTGTRASKTFPEGSRSVDSPKFLTPPKTPASEEDDFGTFETPGGDFGSRAASAGAASSRALVRSASKLASVQERQGRENLGAAALVCRLVDEAFERYPMPKALRLAVERCLDKDVSARPRDGTSAKVLFAAAVDEAEQNDDASSKRSLKSMLRKGGSSVFFTQLSGNEPEPTDVPKGPPTKLRVMLSKARDLPAVDKSRFSRASSDPVCRLGIVGSGVRKVPKKKGHTSSIKMKNLNPTWEETFDLPAHDAVDGAELLVVVEDYDKVGSNDLMGLVSLPLQDIGRGGLEASSDWVSGWYDLLDAKGRADKPRGAVELKYMWVAGQPVPGSSTVGSTVTKKSLEPIQKPARAKLCVEVALGLAAAGEAERAQPFLDEALDAVARAAAIAPPSPAKRPSRESEIAAALALEAAGRRCDDEAAVRFVAASVAKAGGLEKDCFAALRQAAAARERRYHEGHPLVAAARCAVAAQARRCLAPGERDTRVAHERAVASLSKMRGGSANDAERGAAEVVQMARLGADAVRGVVLKLELEALAQITGKRAELEAEISVKRLALERWDGEQEPSACFSEHGVDEELLERARRGYHMSRVDLAALEAGAVACRKAVASLNATVKMIDDAHGAMDEARRALCSCDDAAVRDVLAVLTPDDVECLEQAHVDAVERAFERGEDVSGRHFPGAEVVPRGGGSSAARSRRSIQSRDSTRDEESFSGSEAYTSSGPDDADPVAPSERLHRSALYLALNVDEDHLFDARVMDYVSPTPALADEVSFPVLPPTPRPPTPPPTPPPPEVTPRYLKDGQHRPPRHLSNQDRGTFPQPLNLGSP